MIEPNNVLLDKMREDLSSLARFVDKTRKGIDTLEATVKVGSEKFPEASNQLSSVTGDLENAANSIMNSLENLMADQDRVQALHKELSAWAATLPEADRSRCGGIIKELDAVREKAKSDLMDTFSNMSFQDLTGQKLKKIIGGLSVIETKILEMALDFGYNDASRAGEKKEILDKLKSAEIRPITQDVVDRILRELGS